MRLIFVVLIICLDLSIIGNERLERFYLCIVVCIKMVNLIY